MASLKSAATARKEIIVRQKAEEAFSKTEELYRIFMENYQGIAYQSKIDSTLLFLHGKIEDITGYKKKIFMSKKISWNEIIYPEDVPRVNKSINMLTLIPEQVKECEYRIIRKNGEIRWVHETAQNICDKRGKPVLIQGTIYDVTERKRIEEQLKYYSLYDPLTDLYNRGYFEHKLQEMMRENCYPLGLIIFDVDGLKLLNDTMGYETGDAHLKLTAGILRDTFRKEHLIARIGEDEFAVLLPRTPEATVKDYCEKMKRAIEEYNKDNPGIPLSLSSGYTVREENPSKLSDFIKEAQNRMIHSKLHKRKSTRSTIIALLTQYLNERDFITGGHTDRLQHLVLEIAQNLHQPDHVLEDLKLFAKFHDIGKVGIPDRILFKKGKLSADEFKEMQRHSEIGYRIARSASDLASIADLILKHHEWWNGKGYPLGLKEREIPFECRLLAIADAYDAMTSDRPYRKAVKHHQAVAELRRCAGTQFDPYLVKKFIEIKGEG